MSAELRAALDELDRLICARETTAALFALDDVRALVQEQGE